MVGLVTALSMSALAAAPAAAAGRRVTVAVFGDSVAEAYTIPNFLRLGFVPTLQRALTADGRWRPGGPGFVAATPRRWTFSNLAGPFDKAIPPDGWLLVGYYSVAGYDGLSGYSALASSPGATARLGVADPEVSVLYTDSVDSGPFTVSAGGRSWTISPVAAAPPVDAIAPLELPPGATELTVHGPASGVLSFDGALVRRPLPTSGVQIEVDNLGHAGRGPQDYLAPRVVAALAGQRYDVSVFLWGYLAAVFGPDPRLLARLGEAVRAHVRIAHSHGGACLIADPTPLPVTRSIAARVAAMDRRIAREEGCAYSRAMVGLWRSPADGYRRRLVQVDEFHPTAAGYRLMVRALAPTVRRLIERRLRVSPAPQKVP